VDNILEKMNTPLHISAKNSNFEIVKVLVYYGADPNMWKNDINDICLE